MDGVDLKLATNFAKPATGFIEALLAPKIEKVRLWSKERDLSSYFKDEKLSSLLEKYIERTIKRVSLLSTVVFPQDKVPLSIAYEPVFCIKKGNNPFEDLSGERFDIDINSQSSCFFIVDDAGMGKSTFAKHLCLTIIRDSNKIPVLFELSEFDGKNSLLENIATKFDELDRKFDRTLFAKLLALGKLFIVLDGLDEVPSDLQNILRSEIREFDEKKGKASIVITSRPKERLPSLVDVVNLRIKKLEKSQAISIFRRYDEYSGLTIGSRLESEIEKIPGRFLETPLLVGLLYRTYGFNNSIAEKISVFYSEIFDALYKGHDLTKSGYVREKTSGLDIDEFRQLLRTFSFLFIAKLGEGKHTIESFVSLVVEAKKLCGFSPVSPRHYIGDLLLAVPLLTKDGNSYKFMHRSIAEYFSAEYIARSGNKQELLRKISESGSKKQFSEVIEYIYEVDCDLYREVISAPIAREYIISYSESSLSPLYATMQFLRHFCVSYWKEEDVVEINEQGDKEINIPFTDNLGSSRTSYYMYGNEGDVRYVACCTNIGTELKFIPDGAWVDITDLKIGGEEYDYHRIYSDSNIKELLDNLLVGTFYYSDDDKLINIERSHCIQELLARQNFRVIRRIDDPRNSTRAISLDKCHQLIDTVNRIKKAESEIANLLVPSDSI